MSDTLSEVSDTSDKVSDTYVKRGQVVLEAKIYITLKKTVADPQGLTVKHALESLGYKEVKDVRMGKLVTIKLNLNDKNEAQQRLDEMCKRLLANPIIEDYSFDIRET